MKSFDPEAIEQVIKELDIHLAAAYSHYQNLKSEAFTEIAKQPEELRAKCTTRKWLNIKASRMRF